MLQRFHRILKATIAICFLAVSALAQPDSTLSLSTAGTGALLILHDTPVYNSPGGKVIGNWLAGTPFTSNEEAEDWLRITGYFPGNREWQVAPAAWWVPASAVQVDIPIEKTVEARTFEATGLLYIRNQPGGDIIAQWEAGSRLTSNRQAGDWIRITGHFIHDEWTPNREDWWIHRSGVQDITRPSVPLVPLPRGHSRHIIINKHNFHLNVHEVDSSGREQIIYTTLVGLGRDECMPREQGGNCYFTEPGEYFVRWKIYEPDGIEWCIPPSMEREKRYAADIAAGQRCFPGALGNFALNIGKTYAIHGTSNLDSIGKRMSSGCIRVHNDVAEHLYKLMRENDRVVILEGKTSGS